MVRYLISVFLLFSLLFQACGEAVEPSVPPSPIYYNLFLQDARHRALLSPGGIVRITEPSTVQERIGRAGIAVVRSIEQESAFYAFDLQCPAETNEIVSLMVENSRLVCPRCRSAFEVLQGTGRPEEGIAQSPLRRYTVRSLGRDHLVVSN